jgi:ribosomal protein S18 acetylase RimI-like enzyme
MGMKGRGELPRLDCRVRPARAEDYEEIVSVWEASGLPFSPAGRESREAFAAQLQHFPTSYLVAELGGRIIGVILGTHDRRKGWINRLAVVPEHRRRGVAGKLLASCEAAIQAQGIEIIGALIEPENQDSSAFFERSGYRNDVPARYYRKRQRGDI